MSQQQAVNAMPTALRALPPLSFDGVICFGGEDYWYHNRGHYDMQMMRQISAGLPVLYVNSIGMRTPQLGEGTVFLKRLGRKLKSWSRGLTVVRPGFGVFSPLSLPKFRNHPLARRLLALQVRRAAGKMGITRPLVWVACPPAASALHLLNPAALVYQRTDRFEEFPFVHKAQIAAYDRQLKNRADLTLFCSSLLYEQEQRDCKRALFVDHGVDYDRFAAAGMHPLEPGDLAGIVRPRIGFVGGIDAHTFDPALFLAVAKSLGDCQFVLVGSCSLPAGWCGLPNVHLLGKRDYEQVPQYMAACDVLIMPWNSNEWIKACNPVKLKEYLAIGKPIVTSDFAELKRYEGLVHVAQGPAAFSQAIRQSLSQGSDPARLRRRVEAETWTAKAQAVLAALRGNTI